MAKSLASGSSEWRNFTGRNPCRGLDLSLVPGDRFRPATWTVLRRYAYLVLRRDSGLHRAPVVLKAMIGLPSLQSGPQPPSGRA
jgi:hypothetical protein